MGGLTIRPHTARSRSDDASRREIALADPLAATLRDLRLLDTDCERLVFGMRSAPHGIVLTSSADDLEELVGFVAAEANHETNRRRQKRLDAAFAVLSDILNTIDSADAASGSVEAAGRATASRDDEGLTGRWRIVETELWDREDLDLVAPAFIEFQPDRTGSFGLIAVSRRIDWRSEGIGCSVVEFSWEGTDEGDHVSGRGSAALQEDGALDGRIYFHLGDASGFRAERY